MSASSQRSPPICLRELHFLMIHGLRRIILRSHSFTAVYISRPRVPLDSFSLPDTPNLESVSFSYVMLWLIPAFTFDDASKLREIGLALPTVDSLILNIVSNKRQLPFIGLLILSMKFGDGEELRKATAILSLFPRLQRLEIWMCRWLEEH